ncbi:TPA: hypothetical protein EYP44_00565, partial [Candidatus Bathyarchaeota archaeon]|nr:hypothetical protein [Candidatus Bathyarchaeota archaeon]
SDVRKVLSKLGLDPENMLLIMHQDMIGEFLVLPPQEKLRMVEAAIGFESYRRHLTTARERLNRIVGKERSLKRILEKGEETMAYWKRQYERFQEKRRLTLRLRFLERALAWGRVDEEEKALNELEALIKERESRISDIREEMKRLNSGLERIYADLPTLKAEHRRLFDERIRAERIKASCEARIKHLEELLTDLRQYTEILEGALQEASCVGVLHRSLKERMDASLQAIPKLKARASGMGDEISRLRARISALGEKIEELNDSLLEKKVKLALLRYQRRGLSEALGKLRAKRRSHLNVLRQLITKAQSIGPKVLTGKRAEDILSEINLIRGRLSPLADVNKSAERMYKAYLRNYNKIKARVEALSEDRRSLLDEIEMRTRTWRKVVQEVVESVNSRYQAILSQVGASGRVDLVNPEDIDNVGLELYVGFKGGKVMPLNAYTQSGGEKSVATMVFLLALQQYIRSPFRAVDEYDLHMDPANREAIFRYTLTTLKGQDAQYIIITPSRLPIPEKDIHVLTVQATHGVSTVHVMD